ncbi:MAG TPA: (2Fe-2S) ferredoxin domain-containing protein [Candidatus Obscuribacterales bacterium]
MRTQSSSAAAPPTPVTPPLQVQVCHHTTCLQAGAGVVLQALQKVDWGDGEVVATGCLGHCGNGPMVRVVPDGQVYRRVRSQDAALIAQGHRDRRRLQPRHDSDPQPAARSLMGAYLALGVAITGVIVAIGWTLSQSL